MISDHHNVFLFPSAFNHFLRRDIKAVQKPFQKEKIEGVNYVWLRGVPYQKNGMKRVAGMMHYAFETYNAASLLCRHNKKTPDLVIGSVAHTFAVLSAYLVARRYRCRFWIDVGDLWPDGLISAGTLSRLHPLAILFSGMSNFLYKHAEIILVLTSVTKRHLIEKGVSEDKIVVFPPGIFLEHTPQTNASESLKKNECFTIAYSGSVSPLYPLKEVLKALVLLRRDEPNGIKFRIIGDGSDKTRLMRMAHEMSLQNVEFVDPVPKSELPDIYSESDVLLVIEKDVSFGFPNKLIDYFISGKPVILAASSNYEMEQKCVLRTEPHSEQLARSIAALYKMSPEKRYRIGAEGFRYALEHFDMKQNYERLIKPLI